MSSTRRSAGDSMDHKQPHGSTARRCTAISKRSGEQCRKPAMRGRAVCLAHGGKTPRGIASPHFITGRWSKDIPARLASGYEHARQDPDLLSLREELALVTAAIDDRLSSLGEADDPSDDPAWRAIVRLIDQRRRLVDGQVAYETTMQRVLTVDQAMAFCGSITASIKRHVTDPDILAAIARDMELLTSREGGDHERC